MDKNKRQKQIFNLLKEHPGLRCPQIAKSIGCSRATVERDLKVLKEANYIEFRGPVKKGGGYYLSQQREEAIKYLKYADDIRQHAEDESLPPEIRRKIEWEYFRNLKKITYNDLIFDFYCATEALLSGDMQKFDRLIAYFDTLPNNPNSNLSAEDFEPAFDKAMDAAWYDVQFKYLMQDYPYRDKEYPLLCDLKIKSFPYLNENPEFFAAFIQAIQKNLAGESSDLLWMVYHLTDEFKTINAQVANHIVSSLHSARAVAGQNTDREGQQKVFAEIAKIRDKNPRKLWKEIFNNYYDEHQKDCKTLGWKDARSLHVAYHRWRTGSKMRQPNPLAVRYPSIFADIEWNFEKKDT